jgi:hypothetical protein
MQDFVKLVSNISIHQKVNLCIMATLFTASFGRLCASHDGRDEDVNWQAEVREALVMMVREKKHHLLAEARQLRMKMMPI